MNLLQTRIYYEHEFITSTDVLRARMYKEHEAQVQVNHDDKGVRFGAIITSYVERFLFQESTPYRKESGVSQRPRTSTGMRRTTTKKKVDAGSTLNPLRALSNQ